jgi:hypothetical protein
MANKDKNLINARKRIEASIELAEEERKHKLLTHRIEIAQAGIAAFQKKQIGVAVKNFHMYLKVLEEFKGVSEGGLAPSQFDSQADKNELLMISGIYWDLAKLYDRTNSPEKQKEFHHYMEKYILFSKGMPYQHLCSETLRKYIVTGKALHKSEFKNAYRVIATSRCFVATALVDVSAPSTLPTLRLFRDRYLRKSSLGRRFILEYYKWGPIAARQVLDFPHPIRSGLGKGLDGLASLTRLLFK